MKIIFPFFKAFFITLLIFTLIAMLCTPRKFPKKFTFPNLQNTLISSYGGHDVIHRVIYHGLFGYHKKIQTADMLIMGTSHAELGLSAKKIADALSKHLNRSFKVMNLGIGWGESFPFQKQVILHHDIHGKILLLDLFGTLKDHISEVGQQALTENKITAYVKVIEIWSLVVKDWLLDGLLPRIVYRSNPTERHRFAKTRFLSYSVGFRDWENGDVLDYWFPKWGAVYHQTPAHLITYATPQRRVRYNLEEAQKILDIPLLNKRQLKVITTFIPYKADPHLYAVFAKKLNVPYLKISYQGIPLYDGEHMNHQGRLIATNRLLKQWDYVNWP